MKEMQAGIVTIWHSGSCAAQFLGKTQFFLIAGFLTPHRTMEYTPGISQSMVGFVSPAWLNNPIPEWLFLLPFLCVYSRCSL